MEGGFGLRGLGEVDDDDARDCTVVPWCCDATLSTAFGLGIGIGGGKGEIEMAVMDAE